MPPESSKQKDAVLLEGIEFEGSHGYTAAERKQVRRFRCDLVLETDLRRASESDRLGDTIDYRKICETVVRIGSNQTFKLIEALADCIITELRKMCPRTGIQITLRKLAPPCAGTPDASGVRFYRSPDL